MWTLEKWYRFPTVLYFHIRNRDADLEKGYVDTGQGVGLIRKLGLTYTINSKINS